MIYSSIKHSYHPEQQIVLTLNKLEIRLETARDDLSRAVLIYGPRYSDNQDAKNSKEMNLKYKSNYHDIYSVKLDLKDTRVRYLFYLEDKSGNRCWYNEKGFFESRPKGYNSGYFQYSIINQSNLKNFPEWPKESVIYQIFPDRFYRSGNENFKNREWGKLPKRDSVYGGNLKGITEKLDYLEELGINVIYLTPIFKSPSNHKYNIDDYYQIDENFGSLKAAKNLAAEANKRGIKLILDAVFNHSGSNFFAFEDLIVNQKKSKYKDWYFFDDYPVSKKELNYQSFGNNIQDMPRLNLENEECQNYFLDLAEYWTKELNLAGWRLDVADEVSVDFWQKFRKRVKSIKNDLFIIGEVWYRASNWLKGSTFDSVMNYDLQRDIKNLIIDQNIALDQFSSQIQENFRHYRPEIPNLLINLLDSHDTARFNWEIKKLPEAKINEKMKFAISLQFLLPGIPLIYYGSEIGLTGDDDPDCRRTMIWDMENQNTDLLNFYKKLIKYYRNNKKLQLGDYREIYCDPLKEILIFSRYINNDNNDFSLVIINLSEQKQKININKINNTANINFKILKNEADYSLKNDSNNLLDNNKNCFEIAAKEILIYN